MVSVISLQAYKDPENTIYFKISNKPKSLNSYCNILICTQAYLEKKKSLENVAKIPDGQIVKCLKID